MSTSKNLVVFVDQLGRSVVAEQVSDSKTEVEVKNPSIVHVVPNQQTGQISVQLIPYFFKEFLKPGTEDKVSWKFLKANITVSRNLQLDEKLEVQYHNMYSLIHVPEPGTLGNQIADVGAADAPVVKLFDD